MQEKGRLIWSKRTGIIFLLSVVTNKKLPLFFRANKLYFRNCGSGLVSHKIGFIYCGDNLRQGGLRGRVTAIFPLFLSIFLLFCGKIAGEVWTNAIKNEGQENGFNPILRQFRWKACVTKVSKKTESSDASRSVSMWKPQTIHRFYILEASLNGILVIETSIGKKITFEKST